MRITKKIAYMLGLSCMVFFACDKDSCPGNKVNLSDGQSICIETFNPNFAKKAKVGDRLYHEDYGIVTLTNDGWVTEDKQVVQKIANK